MKAKLLLISVGTSILFLTVFQACVKEIDAPLNDAALDKTNQTFVFNSEIDGTTKVGLAADNSLFWATGDKLAVYDYKSSALYAKDVAALTGGEGTGRGTFSPSTLTENTSWYNADDANSQAYNFYAFYPGGSEASEPSDGSVSVSVAASQQESLGIGKYIVSYAAASTTKSALAGGSAPSFAFSPKSALLKLTLRNSAAIPVKISSIQIAASTNIAGNASLNLSTGVLSSGSSTSITYTPSAPIEIAAGGVASAPVYISLLPCSPGPLTVTLNQAGFVYNAPSVTLATVESGHVYAKDAVISSASRELAITNSYTTNLADASAMDADATLYYGTSNCIVMDANDYHVIIPIGVYKSEDGYTRSDASAGKNTAVKKAKVIWAEKDLSEDPNFLIASGATNILTVTKSVGVTGNALIGIYDGNDDLLWSFHLWCPYDKSVVNVTSEGSSTSFSAFKLALGQITGAESDTYMYYQWGRKDPLGRATPGFIGNSLLTVYGEIAPSVSNAIASTSTDESEHNLAYARKNPATFITSSSAPNDWYCATTLTEARTADNQPNGQNDNLWVSTKATIFDPCPPGYRVAPKALWDGSAAKEPGLFESAGLWYVLGGGRNLNSADVGSVASRGLYWSSDVVGGASQGSYSLVFDSGTSLYRENNYSRARGNAVRCVK